jgi:uncharacterized protein with HEPN domain
VQRDARSYLWDVQQAAGAIIGFIAGLDVRTYAETEVVHSAVERKFEIIGEALSQLSKLDPVWHAARHHRLPQRIDPRLCRDRA